MSIESPIADALELQLKLLAEYGYRVVSVSELMAHSPFEDVHADDDCLDAVRNLEAAGFCLGFQNNTFQPDASITAEQLEAMCSKRAGFTARRITQRTPLSQDEIRQFIAARFGSCPAPKGRTRRDAAIALWQTVSEQ